MDFMAKLYDQLRKAIKDGPKSRYQLWKETDIDQGQLARFMDGISGLSVESMERLIEALGLEIIVRQRRDRKATKRKKAQNGQLNTVSP